MVKRVEYIQELIKWQDEAVIKVVTGLRRCGKSTLLSMFQEYLLQTGIATDQIISINFEDLEYESLTDYLKLYHYISEHLHVDRMNYVFLDEIQMVEDFQKAVDSLYIKKNVDLYLTGSNSFLLSGELATLLAGRYIEIKMLPLSFKEFFVLQGSGDADSLFSDYMKYGSLPYIATLDDPAAKADTYLEGIYNTVIIKDIELRQKRKEPDPQKRKINDLSLLRNIARFLASSIGSPVSVKSISDYITSSGRKISQNTVNDYVEALIEPYIFYPSERYDIKGKQLLKQNRKLYIVDLGLRRHLISRQNYDLGHSLENIVYLELLRRGFDVTIGKVGNTEVDFVAKKGDEMYYYQVAASLTDEVTFAREFAPLNAIPDNHPKTVLTLDRYTLGNYNGILSANVIDWLLDGSVS
jgi:hypothetical protein